MRRRWPWVVWAFSMALTVAAGYLIIVTGGVDPGTDPTTVSERWVDLVTVAAAATAAAVILSHQPRNLIGWFFLFVGLPAMSLTISYASQCASPEACNLVLLIFVDATWFLAFSIGLGGLFLLFPNGRIPHGWRRLYWWVLVAVPVVGMAIAPFKPEVYHYEGATSPWASSSVRDLLDGLDTGVGMAVFLLVLGAIVDFIVRARRSRGVARLQHRWLAWSGIFIVIGGVFGVVATETGIAEVAWIFSVAMATVPFAVAAAITRYRLYDIDRLMSRTVAYALVVAMLAGVVALVAAVVSTQFDSPIVVAATTLGVAAIFSPLRQRVQRVVDRRFNRSSYVAERVMDEFVGLLRDETDSSALLDGWVVVVSETMQPNSVGVWVKS